jgi:glyoxylase I family protein
MGGRRAPARIDGIGGVFILSRRTRVLARWYGRVLGFRLKKLDGGVYYQVLSYRSLTRPRKVLHTVFAIMPAEATIARRRNQAMINYRVNDLPGFIARLKRARVKVDAIEVGPDGEGDGKFTHLRDPDGNRIELWEPSTGV